MSKLLRGEEARQYVGDSVEQVYHCRIAKIGIQTGAEPGTTLFPGDDDISGVLITFDQRTYFLSEDNAKRMADAVYEAILAPMEPGQEQAHD